MRESQKESDYNKRAMSNDNIEAVQWQVKYTVLLMLFIVRFF